MKGVDVGNRSTAIRSPSFTSGQTSVDPFTEGAVRKEIALDNRNNPESPANPTNRREKGPSRPLPRRIASWARHLPDRILHRRRHESVKALMSEIGPQDGFLFICHGNICRSPYAAYRWQAIVTPVWGREVRIDSAGFIGHDRPSPANALAAAEQAGIDMTNHRSQQLVMELATQYGWVIVMEPGQRRDFLDRFRVPPERVIMLGDLDPNPIKKRLIADPFGRSEDTFVRAYERIDRCLKEMACALDPRFTFNSNFPISDEGETVTD